MSGEPSGVSFPDVSKLESVQDILERNRALLYEIKANHELKKTEGLARNFALIKEVNSNMDKVIEVYGEVSKDYVNFMQQRPDSASGKGDVCGLEPQNGEGEGEGELQ